MAKSKLEQVLEHLVNGNEDRAKELLHQVFIEKARAIHEELINDDDELEDDVLGGDEGEQLRHELMRHDDHIDDLSDEIDAEEIMGEGDDEALDADLGDAELDMDDAAMDMDDAELDMDDADADLDMGGDEDFGGSDDDVLGNIDDTMGDLESALEQLKAEFEKLEGGEGSDEFGDEDFGSEDDLGGDDADFGGEEGGEEFDFEQGDEGDEGEEEMDEMFTEEDFDDLAEAIELEKVSIPTSGEVGAGKYSPRDANERSKSPLPASQTQRFGAEPIKTGKGATASGYNRETAPTSQKTKILPKDNRRKTDTQDTENEQTGNYGAKDESKSALDSTDRTFGKGNSTSPLTRAPRK